MTVLAEAAPAKQRHVQALRHALQQIDQENAELQRQYAEQVVLLQDASNTIASCMASFQQASKLGSRPPHKMPFFFTPLARASGAIDRQLGTGRHKARGRFCVGFSGP
jgi:hypothetical protein